MTGWLLAWYGYQPPVGDSEVAQTDFTLNGIQMMMSLIPAGFLVVAAICLMFYNIDKHFLAQIESDLKQRKQKTKDS